MLLLNNYAFLRDFFYTSQTVAQATPGAPPPPYQSHKVIGS